MDVYFWRTKIETVLDYFFIYRYKKNSMVPATKIFHSHHKILKYFCIYICLYI